MVRTLVKKYRQRFFNQLICKNVFIEFEKNYNICKSVNHGLNIRKIRQTLISYKHKVLSMLMIFALLQNFTLANPTQLAAIRGNILLFFATREFLILIWREVGFKG